MKTLNIIGAGKVGKTLGYLFHHKNQFKIQCILNKTQFSTQTAYNFIGAGQITVDFADLLPANFYLLCVPDPIITAVCEQLVTEHCIPKGAVVFHCSGALASNLLMPAKQAGAYIASAHPIFSFSDPHHAVKALDSAMCALEGDVHACQMLASAFATIGMKSLKIEAKDKLLYHASLVIAGNYPAVLIGAALEGLNKIGFSQEDALQFLRPMVVNLIDQVFSKGPLQALTGPIVRGDYQLVEQETQAMSTFNNPLGMLYHALAKYTLHLLNKN